MAEHNETGRQGEDHAGQYLISKGYHILEKNWRQGHKELDIIAETNDCIVVIEVKTRSSNRMIDPLYAVTRQKQRMIIRAANAYVLQKRIRKEVRFDIITVLIEQGNSKIEHLENAFYPTL